MTIGLVVAFLFFAGSMIGWCLEFVYRNLISHKGPKGKFFINPGFCRGPYLPIYGVGIVVMFIISYNMTPEKGIAPAWNIVIGIGICMTLIELIGGWFLLKVLNMRLWDYSDLPFNFHGYICLRFSLIWMALGALYYMVVHPLAIDGLIWLSHNLAFSFFVGLFFGFFIVDYTISSNDARIIKEFGNDYDVIIRYEELKEFVQKKRLENSLGTKFFHQTTGKANDLRESLMEHLEHFEKKIKK